MKQLELLFYIILEYYKRNSALLLDFDLLQNQTKIIEEDIITLASVIFVHCESMAFLRTTMRINNQKSQQHLVSQLGNQKVSLTNSEPCRPWKKWPGFSRCLSSRVNNVATSPEEIADDRSM